MNDTMKNLNRQERRAAVKYISEQSAKYPAHLVPVPREEWPPQRAASAPYPIAVWRSNEYMLQVYEESCGLRLSINRTALHGVSWADGIGWDTLQRLKREAGYGERDAVEVYPPDRDIVHVSNMRHVWVLNEPLTFAWRKP